MADLCLSCGEYVGQNAEDSPYCKCHREELKELKEKAKKWDEATSLESYETLLKNKEVVERLKKEYEWFDEFADKDSDWHSIQVRDLLQNILEGEK